MIVDSGSGAINSEIEEVMSSEGTKQETKLQDIGSTKVADMLFATL